MSNVSYDQNCNCCLKFTWVLEVFFLGKKENQQIMLARKHTYCLNVGYTQQSIEGGFQLNSTTDCNCTSKQRGCSTQNKERR